MLQQHISALLSSLVVLSLKSWGKVLDHLLTCVGAFHVWLRQLLGQSGSRFRILMFRSVSIASVILLILPHTTTSSLKPLTLVAEALALSSAIFHAGDWLNVVPSSTLGLHLHDQEFRLCLKYWLGLPMVEEGSHCPICLRAVDQFGEHQVECGGNGDRIHRHDSIRDALFSAAQTAALAPRKEVLSLIPDTRSHPADTFLPIWQRGQPAALDVTVISTLQQCIVEGAACYTGLCAAVGEETK